MGVTTGCGCKEVDFLILLILYLFFFCSSIPTFCSFLKMFFVLVIYIYIVYNVQHIG